MSVRRQHVKSSSRIGEALRAGQTMRMYAPVHKGWRAVEKDTAISGIEESKEKLRFTTPQATPEMIADMEAVTHDERELQIQYRRQLKKTIGSVHNKQLWKVFLNAETKNDRREALQTYYANFKSKVKHWSQNDTLLQQCWIRTVAQMLFNDESTMKTKKRVYARYKDYYNEDIEENDEFQSLAQDLTRNYA